VCLSYFGSAGNPAHVRYLIRRLRRVMPNVRFLAGFWMLLGQDAKAEEWRTAVGADLVATSLTQALEICVAEARAHAERAQTPDLTAYSAGHIAHGAQARAEPAA
jgi:hypothetical protein